MPAAGETALSHATGGHDRGCRADRSGVQGESGAESSLVMRLEVPFRCFADCPRSSLELQHERTRAPQRNADTLSTWRVSDGASDGGIARRGDRANQTSARDTRAPTQELMEPRRWCSRPESFLRRLCAAQPAPRRHTHTAGPAPPRNLGDRSASTRDTAPTNRAPAQTAGELYICGREKELIILRGANHAPHEFEEALDGLAGVRAGCAVAVGFLPEEGTGEALALLVETEGLVPSDSVDSIRGRVAERTGVRPEAVELLAPGTLPRTSSGKLRRQEALRLWSTGALKPPKAVTALGVTLEMAKGEFLLLREALRRRTESTDVIPDPGEP